MTAQTKAVNKTRFETDDIPTQVHFADMIDSYQDVYSTDINAAITGAASPSAANPFATIGNFGVAIDWYVDSINGSDSNDGKALDTPFLTIAKVMTAVTAGQAIGLVRGSTWHEQLTITANNVRVVAAGNGAPPILDSADIVANASFTKTAGRISVSNQSRCE